MTVKQICNIIEKKYPLKLQEGWDNSGLLVGNYDEQVTGILLTIDVTEKVVDEAISKDCNFIIAHHPIIFRPLKRIVGQNIVEKTVIKAIKNNIAIYGAHTNVDNSNDGINKIICEKLGIQNTRVVLPAEKLLLKLVTFVPKDFAKKVRTAIFEAGAGHIGNYDACSYNIEGIGTFRAGEKTNPFVGKKGELHYEPETRIETIFPAFLKNEILNAMKNAHPYEEIAYDIYPLENTSNAYGSGLIGTLATPVDELQFLQKIKKELDVRCLRHSNLLNKKVKKVAVCSGGCGFLISTAASKGADVFIAADLKYDNFISAQNKILIVDAGHYETEILIKNLFYEFIRKNFINFAVEFSTSFGNPVNYL
jgi:dinuclear metal center YbgI/SA1388 family protein